MIYRFFIPVYFRRFLRRVDNHEVEVGKLEAGRIYNVVQRYTGITRHEMVQVTDDYPVRYAYYRIRIVLVTYGIAHVVQDFERSLFHRAGTERYELFEFFFRDFPELAAPERLAVELAEAFAYLHWQPVDQHPGRAYAPARRRTYDKPACTVGNMFPDFLLPVFRLVVRAYIYILVTGHHGTRTVRRRRRVSYKIELQFFTRNKKFAISNIANYLWKYGLNYNSGFMPTGLEGR